MATIYFICATCGFLSQIIYLTESCFEESCNLLPDGSTGSFCFRTHCEMGKGSIVNIVASFLWIVAGVLMVRLKRVPSRIYIPPGSGYMNNLNLNNLDGHYCVGGNVGIGVNLNGDRDNDNDDDNDLERNILNETGNTQEMDLDMDLNYDVDCKKPYSSCQGSVTDSIFSQGNTEAETEDGTNTVTDTSNGAFPDLLPALEEGSNHESEEAGNSLLRVQVQDIEVDPSRETMFPISPLRWRHNSILSCSEEEHLILSESLLIDEHGVESEDTERGTEAHLVEDDCSNDYSNESSDFDVEFLLMEEIDVVPEEAMFSISPPEFDGDLSQDENELMIPESAVVGEYTVVNRDTHDGDKRNAITDEGTPKCELTYSVDATSITEEGNEIELNIDDLLSLLQETEVHLSIPSICSGLEHQSVQEEEEESESSIPASTAILEHVYSETLAEDISTVPSDVPGNQVSADDCTDDAMPAMEEIHKNTSAEKKEAIPTSPPTRIRRLQENNGEDDHSQQSNDQLFCPDMLDENNTSDGDDKSEPSQQMLPYSNREVAEEETESGDATSVHDDGLLHARILPSTTNLKQLLEEVIEHSQTND